MTTSSLTPLSQVPLTRTRVSSHLLLIAVYACIANTLPMDADRRHVRTEGVTPKVHFPRDRRIPENKWRNRLPSFTATVVFPSSSTIDPPTTDSDIDVSVTRSSLQYRDNLLTPSIDVNGRPNCNTSGSDVTFCEDVPDYPRLVVNYMLQLHLMPFFEQSRL